MSKVFWSIFEYFRHNWANARSRVWACGRSLAGIAGSNPAEAMDVSLLWVLCYQFRDLCDGPISRLRVITSVARLKVIDETHTRDQGPLGLSNHDKNVFHYSMKFLPQIALNSRLNKFLKVITEVWYTLKEIRIVLCVRVCVWSGCICVTTATGGGIL